MPEHVACDLYGLLTPQLLAEARTDTARKWAVQALCIGADLEMFFPPSGAPAIEARQVCAMCPVRGQCLAYAITADEPFGIWGGLDQHERRQLRRRLQRHDPTRAPRSRSAA